MSRVNRLVSPQQLLGTAYVSMPPVARFLLRVLPRPAPVPMRGYTADPQVWPGWDPQEGEIRQTLGPEGQSTGEGHGSLGGGQSRTPRTEPRGVRWGNAPQGVYHPNSELIMAFRRPERP